VLTFSSECESVGDCFLNPPNKHFISLPVDSHIQRRRLQVINLEDVSIFYTSKIISSHILLSSPKPDEEEIFGDLSGRSAFAPTGDEDRETQPYVAFDEG